MIEIEHNEEVIHQSEWVIDLNPQGGSNVRYTRQLFVPLLTGSKTPTSGFGEYKEDRWEI